MPPRNRAPKRQNQNQVTKPLAFVIMPIRQRRTDDHRNYKAIYDRYIKPPLEECGYRVLRADDIKSPGLITKDLVKNLANAELVIADLTEESSNVFYELGIRHALYKKGTILIIDESKSEIPFDLGVNRVIKFKSDPEGLAYLGDEIVSCVEDMKNDDSDTDSLVHDWIISSSPQLRWGRGFGSESNGKSSENQDEGLMTPEQVITEAIGEAEAGLYPKDIIDEAHIAVRDQDMLKFLECIQNFLDVRTFQPSDSEFAQMHVLAERIDARRVSRAVTELGLRVAPDSRWLHALRIQYLSHSTDPNDRALAKQIVQEKLGLQGNKAEFSIETLNKVNADTDLLSYMLDAYHRDGLHDEALKIATELKERFPQSSVALRNYSRALEKKGGIPTDELIDIYREAIVCENPDDTSARWYSSTLDNANRLVDSVEALLFGCMLDLDESRSYALLAARLSNLVQPRNLLRLSKTKRELPKEYLDEDVIKRCILLCKSCPNFRVEDKILCESAMRNIGLTDDTIQEFLDEIGAFSRRDRKDFVIPFYEALKSSVTANLEEKS